MQTDSLAHGRFMLLALWLTGQVQMVMMIGSKEGGMREEGRGTGTTSFHHVVDERGGRGRMPMTGGSLRLAASLGKLSNWCPIPPPPLCLLQLGCLRDGEDWSEGLAPHLT